MPRVFLFASWKAALACSFASKGFFCPLIIYGLLCVGSCDMWYMCIEKKGSVLVFPWNDLIQVSAHSVPVYFLPSSSPLFFTHFFPTPVPCPPLPFLLATNMRISGSSSPHFHRHCFSITTPFCIANVPDAAAVGFRNSALSQNRPIWGNWECASICVCWFRGNI